MHVETQLPLVDEILQEWRDTIGADHLGYRNHVCRMVNFCLGLRECSDLEREKIVVAGCFHDIGIWTDHTVDYIEPSVLPALAYLERRGLGDWSAEIAAMIREHHKVRRYTGPGSPLIELFRQGDLVDFSLGLFRFGLPREFVADVKHAYPNAGFHRGLAKLAGRWFLKHPLDPAPMMKW